MMWCRRDERVAGIRNIVVHLDKRIDGTMVHRTASHCLTDFIELAKVIPSKLTR